MEQYIAGRFFLLADVADTIQQRRKKREDVADTGSAIRNDLQRPLMSGIGVQGPRDFKRDFRKGRGKMTLVEGDRQSAYVPVQIYNIRLTTSHEIGGLSLGNRRCWTTSTFRGFLDVSSSRYFSDGSAHSEVRRHHRPYITRRTAGTRPDSACLLRNN